MKLIYERFLASLDSDKNATIDDVLRHEDINRVISSQYPQVNPAEIE
jgi:hypothetical protein